MTAAHLSLPIMENEREKNRNKDRDWDQGKRRKKHIIYLGFLGHLNRAFYINVLVGLSGNLDGDFGH